MIGQTVRHLRIISELGRGGMGVVYLAEHINLKRRFAVKSLSLNLTQDPQFRERFHQEAQNQALLDHPNIVQATDFFEENGQFFFVMEYVDGQDLGKIIKQKGKLSEKEALAIFKNILEGLDSAHSKGIIHRDVKPQNVLVDARGRVKIMDFGIAIMFGAERLTATGSTVGTPWYMSPEQITHPQNIDHLSDVYSAGVVLYEMLAGEVPFDGDSDFAIETQHVNAPRPDPRKKNPEISPDLAQMILTAMQKDPADRFQGCAEFLECIKAYEKKQAPEPRDNIRYDPKRKLLWLAAAVVLLSIGITVYVVNVHQSKVDQEQHQIKEHNVAQNTIDNVVQEPKYNIEQEHKSAYVLIDSALQKFSIICREHKNIEYMKTNLAIAKKIADKYISDKNRSEDYSISEYNKQITDKYNNISDYIVKYENDKDNRLADSRSQYRGDVKSRTKANDEIMRHLAENDKVNRFLKLRSHYQDYVNTKKKVSDEIMRQACVTK
jgi:serine/threonine protein kinase